LQDCRIAEGENGEEGEEGEEGRQEPPVRCYQAAI
jgi:hypothetical protein